MRSQNGTLNQTLGEHQELGDDVIKTNERDCGKLF